MALTRHAFLIILLLWLPSFVVAQDKVDPNMEKFDFYGQLSFSRWPFEKLVETEKKPRVKSVRIGGMNVKAATYQLRKPAFVVTELCGKTDGGRFGIERDPKFFYRVRSYIAYSFDKHIFGYEVTYEYFDVDSGEELGVGVAGIYVDSNGSGTFTLACTHGETEIDKLPEWIKAFRK
jgi:hypothetical protein